MKVKRELSDKFMHEFQKEPLNTLLRHVKQDRDLDLFIRNEYINVYYKGSSLLRLQQTKDGKLSYYVHEKYSPEKPLGYWSNNDDVESFLQKIPTIKKNIILKHGSSLEIEYEQLIVRANTKEYNNSPEYYITDRQYAVGNYRFDLLGFYWSRSNRSRGRVVYPCVFEIKYALNPDIKTINEQIDNYYKTIQEDPSFYAQEISCALRQRLELGLYEQPEDRLKAMSELEIQTSIENFRFIIVLIDYNPYSKLLIEEELKGLDFSEQVYIFKAGLAMWGKNVKPI